jgi:hypothetical protein
MRRVDRYLSEIIVHEHFVDERAVPQDTKMSDRLLRLILICELLDGEEHYQLFDIIVEEQGFNIRVF